MSITLELFQLRGLLADAAELGAKQALISTGAIKPLLSKAEAYRLYGRAQVDRWMKEGLIKPRKDGNNSSRVRIDRMQLETIAKSSNRITYLTTDER